MVALLEEKHLPGYVKIAGEILKSIEDETFPQGSMLPSERVLAERHNVSSIVVNKALNLLSERGVIEKIPRKGSFVRERRKKMRRRKKRITIYGLSSPKDVNERSDEFVSVLSDNFPVFDFKYTQAGANARRSLQVPSDCCDIIISTERMFAELARDGKLASPDIPDGALSSSDFHYQPFDACQSNGTLMGLPLNFNPSVLYCNMMLLEKSGFGKDDLVDLTWDRFIEICQEMKCSDDAIHPLGYFEYTSCWWENFFLTHGLNIIRNDHFETDIFTSPGLEAIKVMRTLTSGDVSENLTIRRDALQVLSSDKVGFVICNPRLLREMTNVENWFLAPVPQKEASVSAANAFILSISENSKNADECRDIILFLLSDVFQRWLGAEKAIAPVRRSALKKTFNSKDRNAVAVAAETARMLPNHPVYWAVHDEIGLSIRSLLAGAEKIGVMERKINELLYLEHQEWGAMELLGIA
jgi:ABC-type glycerol-3-phosphate transport system substrate-binding protein/DNA-binding transcriptional regulator YhcF (GntR family)